MSRRAQDAQSGQASSEYAIVLGAIAVVCPIPSTLSWPATLDECEDDGWRNFPQFSDEAACVAYVDSLTP